MMIYRLKYPKGKFERITVDTDKKRVHFQQSLDHVGWSRLGTGKPTIEQHPSCSDLEDPGEMCWNYSENFIEERDYF